MRLFDYAAMLFLVWSPFVAKAEETCRGIEHPPFCLLDSNSNLVVEAVGSADILSKDMYEDALQEALLTAKSNLVTAIGRVHCKKSTCSGVGKNFARCPTTKMAEKKPTTAALTELTWKSVCVSKHEIVVRATVSVKTTE